MMDEETLEKVFGAGFTYGEEHGPASPGEAEEALEKAGLPSGWLAVSVFCNGSDDGHAGDVWRLYNMASKEA